MPAIGKITLDIKDYEKALNRARQQGQKFADGSQQDFRKVGKAASTAGTVISAMGSQAGGSFGKLGSIIGAVASGPVVALTAALGALVAVGVDIWDRMTLSAEEYGKKIELAADAAEKHRAAVEKQTSEDAGYIERLQELSKIEELSNEAKTEAATLIKNLASRYGDLGISIDMVTGKISGLDKAQAKFLEQQRKMRMDALKDQLKATQSKVMNQGKQAVDSAFMQWERWLGGSPEAQKITAQHLGDKNLGIDQKIEFATLMRDEVKTEEQMNKWQAVIDSLQKMKELQRELDMLQKTGAATEKEQTDKMQKKTNAAQTAVKAEVSARNAAEKKTEDYYNSTISSLEQQIELQELINAGKLEEANRQKLINELKKQGIDADARVNTITAMQNQLNAAKLAGTQGKEAATLYDRALRAAGRGQEADTRAAIRNAEQAKGGTLTDEERASTLELLELTQTLDRLSNTNIGNLATQTNSLTARGGFATGAVTPDADKYQRITAENGKNILSVAQRIEQICRQFGTF